MLPFQVKEFTSRSGDEIVLLLDRQDGPAFWPNVFVTSQYVVAGRAADTRKKSAPLRWHGPDVGGIAHAESR